MAVAVALASVRVALAQTACESQWIDRLSSQFHLDDRVWASTVFEGRLCVGGDFGPSLGVPGFLARWEPGGVGGRGRWLGFGSGPNARVTAVAELGGRLYAAGNFSNVGGVPANRIAVWDPAAAGGAGGWSPLGSGVNGVVESMLAVGGRLFVGGAFTTAGGAVANRIAVWDPAAGGGAGAWSAVGSGTNNVVRSLALHEGEVVVVGDFTVAGGASALRVARVDPATGSWSSMGAGFNDVVRAVHVGSTGLHVGGDFTASGATSTPRVARWDPSAGGGSGAWVRKGSIDNGSVLTLQEVGGVLYAGGTFEHASGTLIRKVAAWNPAAGAGGAWVGLAGGTNHNVETLTGLDGELHVGGAFLAVGSGASSLVSRHLATWVPSGGPGVGAWRSADRLAGFNNSVITAAVLDGDLYVGGEFTSIGDFTAHRIARWRPDADGGRGAWDAVGGGMNQSVFRLVPHDGALYAVGRFTQAGGVNCRHIARWDPDAAGGAGAWSALGAGLNEYAFDVAWLDGDLYTCGDFVTAGGVAASRIARWDPDTGTWSGVGGGLNDFGVRLLEIDGALWVVGAFTTAGGVTARRIAKWTPGPGGSGTWSEIAGGTNDTVTAIDIHDGHIHIGGRFTEAGGTSASAVAVLDPAANGGLGAWQPLGSGISIDGAHAIAAFETWNGRLVVGGEFNAAGGIAVDNLAAWDASTSTWSGFGGGLGNVVHDLMPYQDRLMVTGKFVGAGDTAAYRIAEWGCGGTAPVSLSIATEPSSSVIAGAAFPQQPRVRLLDSAGGPAAVSGIDVVASIATGGGTLLGTSVATTDASGVASFSDLAISGAAGDRTLAFTAAMLPDVAISATVSVSSPCPPAEFAFTRIRLPATARTTAVAIGVDVGCGWSASTAAAWVSLTPTSGSGDGVLSIGVDPNPGPNGRTATITVSTGGGDVDFELVQTGWGHIVAWGLPKYGLDDPPPGLETASFVATSSNRRSHGAILDDGTVAIWGLDSDGQAMVPAALRTPGTAATVDLSLGPRHVLALRADGTVVAWGRNFDSECDVPAGVDGRGVAAGRAHSVAVRADGTVAAWGRNQVGQCDVPAGLTGVIAVSAGDWHTLALKSDGTVVGWGDDTWGQTTVPEGLESVEAVAAGRNHSLALRSDGTVVAWGDDRQGQATVRSDLADPATADVVAVAGARFASFALRGDGSIAVMGTPPSGSGTVPAAAAGAAAISTGDDATVAIVPPDTTPPPVPPAPPPLLPSIGGGGGALAATPKLVRVPEDRHTIAEALDLVAEGGIVLVGPGVHVASFRLGDRSIAIRSRLGASRTALLGDGRGPAVVVRSTPIHPGRTTVIEGFTILGGAAAGDARVQPTEEFGGGMRIEGGFVVVESCVVADNRASVGGGIAVLGGEVVLDGCEIVGNVAVVRGGGLAVLGGRVTLVETAILGNSAPQDSEVRFAPPGDVQVAPRPTTRGRESWIERIAEVFESWGPCLDDSSRAVDRDGDGMVDAIDLADAFARPSGEGEEPR